MVEMERSAPSQAAIFVPNVSSLIKFSLGKGKHPCPPLGTFETKIAPPPCASWCGIDLDDLTGKEGTEFWAKRPEGDPRIETPLHKVILFTPEPIT